MASEIDRLNYRMSRLEGLVHSILTQDGPRPASDPDGGVGTPACERCGAKLSNPETKATLRLCRQCRTHDISELMSPRKREQVSTPSQPKPRDDDKRNRLERIREALDTIELIVLAKQYYTYAELEKLLHLPQSVLSRYAKGHVLPAGKRGSQIRATLLEAVKLGAHLTDILQEYGVDAIQRINVSPHFLWFTVQHIVHLNAGRRITKVLTATEHGVPLATLLSYRLSVPLTIATLQKQANAERYLESVLPTTEPYLRTIYLPSYALKRNDAVFIVTDILSDGAIQVALEKIVENAKATPAAIWATIVTTDNWMKTNCPVESLAKAKSPPLPLNDTPQSAAPTPQENTTPPS